MLCPVCTKPKPKTAFSACTQCTLSMCRSCLDKHECSSVPVDTSFVIPYRGTHSYQKTRERKALEKTLKRKMDEKGVTGPYCTICGDIEELSIVENPMGYRYICLDCKMIQSEMKKGPNPDVLAAGRAWRMMQLQQRAKYQGQDKSK